MKDAIFVDLTVHSFHAMDFSLLKNMVDQESGLKGIDHTDPGSTVRNILSQIG